MPTLLLSSPSLSGNAAGREVEQGKAVPAGGGGATLPRCAGGHSWVLYRTSFISFTFTAGWRELISGGME